MVDIYAVKTGSYYVREFEMYGHQIGCIILSREKMTGYSYSVAVKIAEKIKGEVIEIK